MENKVYNWKSVCWGDLATLEYGKGLREYKEGNDSFPVYGTNGQIGWHSEYLYPKSGVIVGRKGAYRGIHFSKKPFFVIDTAFYLKPKDEKTLDIRWAYYQLLNFDINKIDSGSAIPSTSREAFYAIHVQLPTIITQRKIAAILSAYDDLIENNLRRIKILEEMAQNLYREWFVKFRFPGHQKVKMVNSPLGKIPEGWEIEKLGKICKIIPGYAFKSKDWMDSGIPVIKIKNISSDNTVNIEDVDYVSKDLLNPNLEKFTLNDGDMLVAMTGATAGKVGKVRTKEPLLLNQRVAKIAPGQQYKAYVCCLISLKDTQEKFYRLADGAAQPNMSGGQIENFVILLPPDTMCQKFSSIIDPVLLEIDNLIHRNRILRQTRDLLLPKLISGELDVSEFDITIPEANA